MLTDAPVLAFPDYEAPFTICTNASALGLGAVLMQCNVRGRNYVIAYATRVLNAAKANYSVTHLETVIVVWLLKHFKDIVPGYPITIYTDHAAVIELFKGKNLKCRLARWHCTIQEFAPKFKYFPGRANAVVVDALSRNAPMGAITNPAPVPKFTLHDTDIAQRQHDVWASYLRLRIRQ